MRRIHIYIIALILFLAFVGYVFFIRDIERDIVAPHRQGSPLRWHPSPLARFQSFQNPLNRSGAKAV